MQRNSDVLPKYFLVSCLGLTIDAGLLFVLNSWFGVPYIVAGTVSFLAGAIIGYFLCVRFVFEASGRSSPTALTLFVALGGAGVGVNAIVLAGAVELTHAPVLVAKGASAVCTFFVNYWLRRRWVFTPATAS